MKVITTATKRVKLATVTVTTEKGDDGGGSEDHVRPFEAVARREPERGGPCDSGQQLPKHHFQVQSKEDSALEEARRGGSNETVQKHESRATAVGNAYATAAAAVLSVPDLAANITAASTTIINEIVESLDDLEKSEASEEVKEAGRPCAAAPADSGVTSQSLDGVREAIVKKAAEDDDAELVEEANSVLGHLAAQLRELEAAVATAAGAEADAKAASESSAGAMSLVVAAAALLLGARL
ncbi:putative Glutamic acid alanine rich protein of Trypanosoma [Trypanosoma vivax]|nr:putative Glutamic acid alanine rich protein of Trypanosoma [Trypanosoma vivax]